MAEGNYRKDLVPELDGLRAIAVLLVLWVHLPVDALGLRAEAIRSALLPGNVGVDLFFVLSGFLITRILLVDREAGVPLRHFLVRRFLRIFPIYYLSIAVLAPALDWQEIVACASYTSNFAFLFKGTTSPLEHTWSLAVEEHFYLLWPPVVAFLAPTTSRRVLQLGVLPLALAGGLCVLAFADWASRGDFWHEFLLRSSTVRCFSLGLGACAAYHEGWLRRERGQALALALGAAAVCWATSEVGLRALGLRDFDSAPPGGFPPRALHSFSVPFASLAAVLLTVVTSGSRLPHARALRWTPLRGIGRISYGLYLYHFPIFIGGAFAPAGAAQPLRTLVVVALCFLVASASYRIVEQPLLDLAKRFRAAGPARWASPFTPIGWLALALFVPALAWLLNDGAAELMEMLFPG